MSDKIDFGTTNINKLFARFFFPTLLGMVFNMAFIITDGIFVGHSIGPYGLAAINLVAPIMMLINGLGMMFGMGASVMAAIHLSKGDVGSARRIVTRAFATGILVSLLMGVVCYAFPRPILTMLGATGDQYAATYEYYMWFIPTCLLMMIASIGLFVIRLDGSPRYAMLANMIPALVNIALDYLFIFPCHWGLMGASLATDLGDFVGTLMVVYYMIFRADKLRLCRSGLRKVSHALREVAHIVRSGATGLLGELSVAVLILIGNRMFLKYSGTDGVAAYSVACYLFPLLYMVFCAVAQSAQPIISYNYGTGATERVKETRNYSLKVSILMGLVGAAILFFLANPIVAIFLDTSTAAYHIAASGLPYYATAFVFMAFNICIIGYLQSIELARAAVVYTLLRGVVLLVAAFLLLPPLLASKGLWLAIPTAELLTALAIVATKK